VLASFRKLIREHGTAALYITHDLCRRRPDRPTASWCCAAGKMIELGDTGQI